MEKFLDKKKKNSGKFCSKMPLGPTSQEFWPEYNSSVLGWKLVDSIYSVRLDTVYFAENNKKKFGYCSLMKILCTCLDALFMFHEQCTRCWNLKRKKKKKKKKRQKRVCMKTQTQSKRSYSGSRNKWKNLLQEKKKSVKFCSIMPLGLTGQEFWPEYNFGIFARKFVGGIYIGLRNKWKSLWQEKKKKSVKFCFVMPWGTLGQEFSSKNNVGVLHINL